MDILFIKIKRIRRCRFVILHSCINIIIFKNTQDIIFVINEIKSIVFSLIVGQKI